MGSLIRDDQYSIMIDGLALDFTLIAGTLTGARSLIAKAEIEVETRRSSWAV